MCWLSSSRRVLILFLNGRLILMFYVNVHEASVKVSDISLAIRYLSKIPLVEAIKEIKDFHEDMELISL